MTRRKVPQTTNTGWYIPGYVGVEPMVWVHIGGGYYTWVLMDKRGGS